MKLSALIILGAHAEFRYKGTDIYSQAGLDVTGWNGWTTTQTTASNGKTCNKVTNPPTPKTPSEHMLGLYYEGWKPVDEWIKVIPWDIITHLYYAFVAPSVHCHIPITETLKTSLEAVRSAGASAGDKVRMIIAVGGWADSRHFSWCLRNQDRRTKLVGAIAEVMSTYNYHGIDIDWEHPRSGGCLGTSFDDQQVDHCEGAKTDWMDYCEKPNSWSFHNSKDVAGYAQFVADLRAVLGYNSHISATVGIGEQMGTVWGDANAPDRFNFNVMCKYVNFLQLMTYDYMGLWNNPKVTSHQAAFGCDPADPLQQLGSYPYKPSGADWCSIFECGWEEQFKVATRTDGCAFPRLHTAGNVEWFVTPWEPTQQGDIPCSNVQTPIPSVWTWGTCPAHRIAIGVAAYGRGYCGVESGTETGEYRVFTEYCPTEGDTPVFVDYRNVETYTKAAGAKTFFNERTQTPFMYNPDKKYWLSYTDPRNVKAVTTYTLCRGLAGVFMWAATGDTDDHQMMNAAREAIDAAASVSGTSPAVGTAESTPTDPPPLEGDKLNF